MCNKIKTKIKKRHLSIQRTFHSKNNLKNEPKFKKRFRLFKEHSETMCIKNIQKIIIKKKTNEN